MIECGECGELFFEFGSLDENGKRFDNEDTLDSDGVCKKCNEFIEKEKKEIQDTYDTLGVGMN